MSQKTKLKLFFGTILTVIILYYSVKSLGELNPQELFRQKINWGLAILSVLVFMYSNYIRGLAYTRGIDPGLDRMTAFRIVGIGHAANMVLPLRAGEGLRLAFFPERYGAVERTKLLIIPGFADFVAIMLLALPSVPFAGFKDPVLLKVLWILVFLILAVGALGAVIVYLVPKLRGYAKQYLNPASLKMMYWVVLSWIIMLVSTWIGLLSLGYPALESARMSLAVFTATNIVSFIPASPGGIGLFEYGVILGLGGLGVKPAPALSIGLMIHLMQYAALVPLGAVLYVTAIGGKFRKSFGARPRPKQK
ncbi:MAG TPA: lysylphosphatidylglycerol synthase transmembrane domain-containing protein [Clostridia bacterium]|nr:lysylphosphatidylglycerol synthase transmembrane domain-containing protein [Clostridia bacterium]